jgi:glucose/arabinose dehydrogenase
MRFARFTVFALLGTVIYCGTSLVWAQNSPTEPFVDLNQPSENVLPVRTQSGSHFAALRAGDGLVFERLSQGLGVISALAIDASGTLYVADRGAGRLWRLRDRNQDGRYEFKQALPQRFDQPSGLAISGKKIYISDRNAVWVMNGMNPPRKLAGLVNSGSRGTHHPLSLTENGKTLYLGLSTKAGEAKLLQLNVETGEAALVQNKETNQEIIGLVAFGDSAPWLALEHGIGPSLKNITPISHSHSFKSLALPVSAAISEKSDWPAAFKNKVIVSRQSGGGYDVLALPAGFGQIDLRAKIIFSGFMSTSGRSVWGRPGPLLFDTEGLIVADSKNGDIYRLKAAPMPVASEQNEDPATLAPPDTQSPKPIAQAGPPDMQVSTIREGSQIGSASALNRGSNLDVGSTIIRDYEPLSLEKEGLEEAEEKKAEPEGIDDDQ